MVNSVPVPEASSHNFSTQNEDETGTSGQDEPNSAPGTQSTSDNSTSPATQHTSTQLPSPAT